MKTRTKGVLAGTYALGLWGHSFGWYSKWHCLLNLDFEWFSVVYRNAIILKY